MPALASMHRGDDQRGRTFGAEGRRVDREIHDLGRTEIDVVPVAQMRFTRAIDAIDFRRSRFWLEASLADEALDPPLAWAVHEHAHDVGPAPENRTAGAANDDHLAMRS